MPSIGPSVLRARARGLPAVLAAAGVAVLLGCLFGGEQIGIPGLVDPVPAVRVFPALVAAVGSLALLEPWKAFEVSGVRPVWRHRGQRFATGLAVVVAAGSALSANAGARTILVLAVVFYAAMAVAVGLVGRQWWILVALALYAQLFIQEYEEFRPGFAWGVLAAAVAWPWYLGRGEAVLGRSAYERSPT